MGLASQVRVRENQADNAKKLSIALAAALLATSVYVLLQRVYLLRELLLLVACVAILVFFAATLALLGILFRAAGQGILHSIRKATPRIAQQHVSRLVVSRPFAAIPQTPLGPVRTQSRPVLAAELIANPTTRDN